LLTENGRCFFQFGDDKTRRLEVPAGGVARFRIVFKQARDPVYLIKTGCSVSIVETDSNVWTGTARSNDVLLRILPAPPGYLPPAQANPPPGSGQVVFVPGK